VHLLNAKLNGTNMDTTCYSVSFSIKPYARLIPPWSTTEIKGAKIISLMKS